MAKVNATAIQSANPAGAMSPVKSSGVSVMSSKEVAKLTSKQHAHVLRDIRKMLKDLDDPNLDDDRYQELTDDRGYSKEFLLNEELTLTLVSGYNVKMRNAIIRRWKELESGGDVVTHKMPLASCAPIMYHGTAVLMFHRPKKDWVCFRSLCEVTGLDYRYHARMVRESELCHASIEQTGEQVFCITYQAALVWLGGINPEKIRLNKRHKVVSAMLQLPKLLTAARDAYREITKALPSPTLLLPKGRAALLEALEKIEGKKLAVIPCEVVLAFDDKASEVRRKCWQGISDLGFDLMNSGYTVKSLRGVA